MCAIILHTAQHHGSTGVSFPVLNNSAVLPGAGANHGSSYGGWRDVCRKKKKITGPGKIPNRVPIKIRIEFMWRCVVDKMYVVIANNK